MDIHKPSYGIVIRDAKQQLITNANIQLTKLSDVSPKNSNSESELESSSESQLVQTIRNFSQEEIYANTFYDGDTPLEPGTYRIRVEAEGMEAQERIIEVNEQGFVADFVLGRPGLPYYWEGEMRVPYDVPENLIGIQLNKKLTKKKAEELAEKLGLSWAESGKKEEGLHLLKLPKGANKADYNVKIAELEEEKVIERAGLLVNEEDITFATTEAIVTFSLDYTESEIYAMVAKWGHEIVEVIDLASAVYLVKLNLADSITTLECCNDLINKEEVTSIEPNITRNLKTTAVLPAIDYIQTEKWDFPRLQIPQAWTFLRSVNGPLVNPGDADDRTYGSTNLCIAIYDDGVQSINTPRGNTIPRNPSFATNVTSGQAKVVAFRAFNVTPYPTHNNNLGANANHGDTCGGAALAGNHTLPGNNAFRDGLLGSAPNLRMLPVLFANNVTHDTVAFRWMSGNNQPAPIANLTAPIVSPQAADIISNSWKVLGSTNAYDRIFRNSTTYGRRGRGTIILFAAANDNATIRSQSTPSAHPRVICVGAISLNNTLNDIRAPYSNFGPEVDVVAYSDSPIGTPNHNPPNSWGAITSTFFNRNESRFAGMPGGPGNMTTQLTQIANIGVTIIEVQPTTGFTANMRLIFGQPNDAFYQSHVIRRQRAATLVELTTPIAANNIPVNTTVRAMTNQHFAIEIETATAIGDGFVHVRNLAGFQVGQDVLIGIPGTITTHEIRNITGIQIAPANRLLLDIPLQQVHTRRSTHRVHVLGGFISSTVANTAVSSASRFINVASSARFHVGQRIMIGNTNAALNVFGEPEEIDQITSPTRIRVRSNPRRNHPIGTAIVGGACNYINNFSGTSYACPVVAGICGLMLSAKPTLTWTEVRNILRHSSTKILPNQTGTGQWRDQAGLLRAAGAYAGPYFSQFYGYGRVNALQAVTNAHNYNHDHRDLMIRNHLGDNGRVAVNAAINPIQSPDIWIRNTLPTSDALAALPTGYVTGAGNTAANIASYDIEVPHENPGTNNAQDRYLYARIKNRGTMFGSLFATARFYILRSNVGAPYTLPYNATNDAWENPLPANGIRTDSAAAQVFLIGERLLFDAPADDNLTGQAANPAGNNRFRNEITGGIPAGENFIVKQQWSRRDLPPAGAALANRRRFFACVEITPHDGEMNGLTVGQNNNFSTKELTFATFRLARNITGDALPSAIPVNANGTADMTYHVRVRDTIGYFHPDDLEVILTRIKSNGQEETTTQKYTAGVWGNTPAAPWATATAPVLPNAAAPANRENDIDIAGQFTVDTTDNRAKIVFLFKNDQGAVVWKEEHEMMVVTVPVLQEPNALIKSGRPRFHVFTDMAMLAEQSAIEAYGPAPAPNAENIFETTARFHAINVADTIPAFAAVNGTIMIQQQTGNPDKVNLILKPLRQSRIGFTPVKYLIYRGLELTDFLKGKNGNDLKVLRSKTDATELIKEIYQSHHARRIAAHQRAVTEGTAAGPPPAETAPPATALGMDSTQLPAHTLDQYFFQQGSNNQLPLVNIGTLLGNFRNQAAGDTFGFEIILEEGTFRPTLEHARKAVGIVDISVLNGLPKALKAEEILNYIDPAAYYGMHYIGGIETPDNNTPIKTLRAAYDAAVIKFFTRNHLYLDIRNSNTYSMNYYQSYNVGGNQIQVGTATANLAARAYATNTVWPIVILTGNSQTTNANVNRLSLRLAAGNNDSPVLYSEWGDIDSPSIKDTIVLDSDLEDTPWTKEVRFITPNIVDPVTAADRLPVVEHIKLFYFRRVIIPLPGVSKIVPSNSYTDNIFGPLGAAELFTRTGSEISWTIAQDKRLVDNHSFNDDSETKALFVAERGVAHEQGSVIYYAAASDLIEPVTEAATELPGIASGVSRQGNFFDLAYLFSGLDLKIRKTHVDIGSNQTEEVNLYQFESAFGAKTSPKNFLALGIKDAEKTLLENTLGIGDAHERSIVLEELTPSGGLPGDLFEDSKGTKYHKYKLKVQGWDPAGNYKLGTPNTDVFVYSLDGLIFGSKDFYDRPIPKQAYTPTLEENRAIRFGVKIDPLFAANQMLPLETAVNNFQSQINQFPTNDTAQLKSQLDTFVTQKAKDLWNTAKTQSRLAGTQKYDARPLYWARLKMMIALQRFTGRFLPTDTEDYARVLNRFSRGYFDVEVGDMPQGPRPAGAKRILILALDPYITDANVERHSPGASLALALDGLVISHSGTDSIVQTVILPIQYKEFDRIQTERYLGRLLQAEKEDKDLDAIFTIGAQVKDPGKFDIDRFAVNARSNIPDNEGKKSTYYSDKVTHVSGIPDHFESNITLGASNIPSPDGTPQTWHFDQSIDTDQIPAADSRKKHPTDGGTNSLTAASVTLPGKVVSGSAGNTFANNLAYRVMLYRERLTTKNFKTAHLSLPFPKGTLTLEQVVDSAISFIKSSLPNL